MRRFGLLVAAAGAVAFIASLALLKYADLGLGGQTMWQFTTRLPVVLTVLAALTLGLSLLALAQRSRVYPALATAIGFYVLGQFFPDGNLSYTPYKAGFWVCVAGAVAMAVGSLIALVAARPEEAERSTYRDRAVRAPSGPAPSAPLVAAGVQQAPAATAMPVATEVPNAAGAIPAGWFPDPLGEAGERYWSGSEWTHQVRP
jgi:Protein of unknown function (DUF2510)